MCLKETVKFRAFHIDQRHETGVILECLNMVQMLSVLVRDSITLFSIHEEHYTKALVNNPVVASISVGISILHPCQAIT